MDLCLVVPVVDLNIQSQSSEEEDEATNQEAGDVCIEEIVIIDQDAMVRIVWNYRIFYHFPRGPDGGPILIT